ncbi:hypothetical protein WICMUC_004030 [Wickerhamomyces mucosus]|uniref:Lysophospholipase n=1 Tax=Wickerhamomyces mucosus TaxID=1378264 RepID=A0A9P8PI90_9ASCO|nr:hypothetical protein WICMUC_004030 [Wickerhamomyces mucosus]
MHLLDSVSVLAFILSAVEANSGYAPEKVSCPSDASFVREANALSSQESEWLDKRHTQTQPALKEFLTRAGISDFDIEDFFDDASSNITIGLAFSGGGYRAMLNGAGQLSALDSNTRNANELGLGGICQSSTYLVGSSGGNWLTGSIALNDWIGIEDLVYHDEGDGVWDLNNSIFDEGGWNVIETISRFTSIAKELAAKKDAGFETSITDLWGRLLSYQFFGSDNDASTALTFSSIKETDAFQNALVPFPISVADGRVPGSEIINLNSTLFEFNPFELGSWDYSLKAFTDLKYVGTPVNNGRPTSDYCIKGYDNAGFVLGSSSSLFNELLLDLKDNSATAILYELIEDFLTFTDNENVDVAIWNNNPFYNTSYGDSETVLKSNSLYLVDGGEDGEVIPFAPLLQSERELDIIFGFDSTADSEYLLPNGDSLVATYERQFLNLTDSNAFPYVPDTNTFLEKGLTSRPTFFGCNGSNLTELSRIPPLIVYVPNIPYTYLSNTSTFKMQYSNSEKYAMVQNGFEISSRKNLTLDSDWQKCIGCAVIQRELERTGQSQPNECKECFDRYCWDGSLTTNS